MARLGISYDDVMLAITSLKDMGETITIDKVRQFLGNTGSNTTISKYINMYKENITLDVYAETKRNIKTPNIIDQAVKCIVNQLKQLMNERIEAAEKRALIAEEKLKKLKKSIRMKRI